MFLPPDSEVATALDNMEELFGRAQRTTSVTLIFRGAALSPAGLAQIDDLLGQVERDPRIAPALAPPDPISAPPTLLARALGPVDFAEIARAAASLPIGRRVGVDLDGGTVAIAKVRLLQDLDGDGESVLGSALTTALAFGVLVVPPAMILWAAYQESPPAQRGSPGPPRAARPRPGVTRTRPTLGAGAARWGRWAEPAWNRTDV